MGIRVADLERLAKSRRITNERIGRRIGRDERSVRRYFSGESPAHPLLLSAVLALLEEKVDER